LTFQREMVEESNLTPNVDVLLREMRERVDYLLANFPEFVKTCESESDHKSLMEALDILRLMAASVCVDKASESSRLTSQAGSSTCACPALIDAEHWGSYEARRAPSAEKLDFDKPILMSPELGCISPPINLQEKA
jgi:hypothetical protein